MFKAICRFLFTYIFTNMLLDANTEIFVMHSKYEYCTKTKTKSTTKSMSNIHINVTAGQ